MGKEIEKKFIIEMPEAFPEDAVRSEIVQYFLKPDAEFDTRRVRSRTTRDKVVLTYTEKKFTGGFTRIENEREISEEEFASLLRERDERYAPIRKTRYVYPYAGHVMETDIFPFWDKYAILEVELAEESESFTLPEQIIVIADVTEDKRFTNKSLAVRVPDPEEFSRRH